MLIKKPKKVNVFDRLPYYIQKYKGLDPVNVFDSEMITKYMDHFVDVFHFYKYDDEQSNILYGSQSYEFMCLYCGYSEYFNGNEFEKYYNKHNDECPFCFLTVLDNQKSHIVIRKLLNNLFIFNKLQQSVYEISIKPLDIEDEENLKLTIIRYRDYIGKKLYNGEFSFLSSKDFDKIYTMRKLNENETKEFIKKWMKTKIKNQLKKNQNTIT